ncbi:MAG: tyrosinase family protein [Scytonema sp. PMC 1069.18]|nr:tyrosinase family protein [Scytonema sp. PMC 1069.18]MEC4883781.1 tyrosinase family protein [Scytonema sp. PMC 1070.18]
MNHLQKFFTTLGVGIAIATAMIETSATAATLVRKSVVDLTQQEKEDLVNAIKTLKTIPGSNDKNASVYDELVAIHTGAMTFMTMHLGGQVTLPQDRAAIGPAEGADVAHENAGFLPWHREYLSRFEAALQSVNPNVTVPYWDWSDPRAVDVIFQPDFLGTNGSGQFIDVNSAQPVEIPTGPVLQGGPVLSGNFSEAEGWTLIPDLHSNIGTGETLGTSLIRFLPDPNAPAGFGFPLSQEETARLLQVEDYGTFRRFVEGVSTIDENGNEQLCEQSPCTHNLVHGLVGGTLRNPEDNPMRRILTLGTLSNTPGSPNDPVFWLLHANVDRLWAEWQADSRQGPDFYPSEGEKFGHNLNDPMWPWDGGLSYPGTIGSTEIQPYLATYAPDDVVRPINALNWLKYGYTYDTLVKKVPESSSIFGLLGLGSLGAASLLRRKRSSKLSVAPLRTIL